MTLGRKLDEFKAWLRDIFPSENRTQDGLQRHTGSGGFFNNAQHSTVHNSTMIAVQGNQYNTVTYSEGDRHIVAQMMGLLSQHIIRGAAHDSSARKPPPRCHPETRVKLIARITAWFEGQASLELLLWITGPAGVGKSAVVQTFAEYLAKSHLLGASVFISRPNKRDNPDGVFITIAYQLATRIQAYRDYVVERLRLDPELLSGDMQAQFTTFIIEPFVEKKIGAGVKRWGILLDGLDELRGTDAQCEIIQLISSFAHEHPNAPLVWIIASRPESHISYTFKDEEVRRHCLVENVPIDSTEACEDVERFLRSSFKMTQKKFRHCVSSDWPSNFDFLKLTAAASGLFIYAQVVMQFIGDSHHGDPVARLEVLISVIDRSNAVPTKENPFVYLDALYHEILSSIPSTLWPTTKQIFGVAIYGERIMSGRYKLGPKFLTLRGTSILFGVTLNAVYASLDKSRSTLKIPVCKVAHKKPLAFLHASFSDFLKDSSRSGDFHIGNEEDVKEEVMLSLLKIWNKCCGDDIAASSVEPAWHQYCSKLAGKTPLKGLENFHTIVFRDIIHQLNWMVPTIIEKSRVSPAFASLREVHMRKLCYFFDKAKDVEYFVESIMRISLKLWPLGFLPDVPLKDLKFGHLDWKDMSPTYAHYHGKRNESSKESWTIHRPRSSAELKAFVSDLDSLQKRLPKLLVSIVGSVPKERVVVFGVPLDEKYSNFSKDTVHYVIPYSE